VNSFALLDAWEDARRLSRFDRPLVLLAAWEPQDDVDSLARLPIGARDARLLSLREEMFGTQLSAGANCPHCGESVDISLSTSDIRIPVETESTGEEFELVSGRFSVRFRLPTTADLRWVAAAPAGVDRRMTLLRRCIVDSGSRSVDKLPTRVLNAVATRMGEADPQAIVDLAVDCPSCNETWLIPFDICSFLWNEFDELAQRIFREIHTLARAYGWSETEILQMSPMRRRVYLEMVEA